MKKGITMTESYDYAEYEERPADVGDNVLKKAASLATEQLEAEKAVEEAQANLKAAQEKLRIISEHTIPNFMDEIDMNRFETGGGISIELSEKVRTHIKKEDKGEAHDWLEDNGRGAVVKRTFKIAFGRDDEKWANKFAADLRRRKRKLNVAVEKKVEPSTLTAMCKEMLEQGVDFPLELFGVLRQRYSKIKVNTKT